MKGEVRGSNQRRKPFAAPPLDCAASLDCAAAVPHANASATAMPAPLKAQPLRLPTGRLAPALDACGEVSKTSLVPPEAVVLRRTGRARRPVHENAAVAPRFPLTLGEAAEQVARARASSQAYRG